YSLLKKLLQAVLRAGDLSPENAAVPAEGAPAHADLWPAALCAVLDQPVTDSRWNSLEPLLRRRVIIEAVCDVVGRVISARPSLLGKDEGLAALKSRILRHTGQIPLFIEEVARQLIDRGVTGADAGRFAESAQWDALEIPPTVQGVIASRIDRLPKEEKTLLQL